MPVVLPIPAIKHRYLSMVYAAYENEDLESVTKNSMIDLRHTGANWLSVVLLLLNYFIH